LLTARGASATLRHIIQLKGAFVARISPAKSGATTKSTTPKTSIKTAPKTAKRTSAQKRALPETIGVGIIGAGSIARGVHIPGYQKLPNVKVVAVSDTVEAARAAVTKEFGIENTYADFHEMLARDDIHAVSVTTPNFLHAQATIAALEAGKHVLCEKPLAMNAIEGEAMCQAARRTGMKLMCGLHWRFTPQVQVLKRFAQSGGLGDMYYARAQALRRRGIPSWGFFISKEKNGGGPLIDIGVHVLDATLHVLGFPKVVSVSGQTYQKFGKRKGITNQWGPWDYKNFTVEDFAVAFVRFEGGATLVLESSFAANQKENEKFTFQIFGDKGGANLEPLQMFTEQQQTLLDISPAALPQNVQAHHAQIASFIHSLATDTPVFTPGEEALQVTRILDAIYESSERGEEVKL